MGDGCERRGPIAGIHELLSAHLCEEADRDAYLPHPDHLALADLVKPYVEKVVVVDFWRRL